MSTNIHCTIINYTWCNFTSHGVFNLAKSNKMVTFYLCWLIQSAFPSFTTCPLDLSHLNHSFTKCILQRHLHTTFIPKFSWLKMDVGTLHLFILVLWHPFRCLPTLKAWSICLPSFGFNSTSWLLTQSIGHDYLS